MRCQLQQSYEMLVTEVVRDVSYSSRMRCQLQQSYEMSVTEVVRDVSYSSRMRCQLQQSYDMPVIIIIIIIIKHLLSAIHPGKNLLGGADKTFST